MHTQWIVSATVQSATSRQLVRLETELLQDFIQHIMPRDGSYTWYREPFVALVCMRNFHRRPETARKNCSVTLHEHVDIASYSWQETDAYESCPPSATQWQLWTSQSLLRRQPPRMTVTMPTWFPDARDRIDNQYTNPPVTHFQGIAGCGCFL